MLGCNLVLLSPTEVGSDYMAVLKAQEKAVVPLGVLQYHLSNVVPPRSSHGDGFLGRRVQHTVAAQAVRGPWLDALTRTGS